MKKILLKLTENDLTKIIKSTVSKVLKEFYDVGEIRLDDPSEFKIVFLEKQDILPIADEIWKMLCISYENIGGIKTYANKNDFIRKVKYAKIAYAKNTMVACAMYRRIEDSFKMVAIGCNQYESGKFGIQSIIKSDIEQLNAHYWAEVSGAIEHYFKKFNGFPIPNTLAASVLNVDPNTIRLSEKDKVHYTRKIVNEWFEKMIFGIKSEEIYYEAIKAVEDYSTFMQEVNKINESKFNGFKYSLKQAIYIIENIYRAHEEDGFNELIPSWKKALEESMKTLQASEKTNTVTDYIEYCQYLFDTMQPLELHELSI